MEPSYPIVTPYVSRPLSKKFSFHTTIIHSTQIHEINNKIYKTKKSIHNIKLKFNSCFGCAIHTYCVFMNVCFQVV